MKKKVLIITYYWPPDNSSGVQRWAYFAHFLQLANYDVTVVTVDAKKASYKNTDQSFTELTENIKTIRTATLEPLKAYSMLTTGSAHKGIPRGGVDSSKSFFKKIASIIKENLFIPDARLGWNSYAMKAAQKLIEKQMPDIMITTGPPQSTHLVGLRLKKKFPMLKWLADFRDPWVELYSIDQNNKSAWAQKRNEKLEQAVLHQADSVLTIGPSMQKLLQQKIPKATQNKVAFIYNGYDDTKMANLGTKPNDKFTITFVGLMADEYQFDGFVVSIMQLGALLPKVRLQLAGNIAPRFLEAVEKIEDLEVDYNGFVAHSQSLSLMKNASMLFTILPSQPQDEIIISGKMMEYLSAQKPILCIGNKKGDAAALIKENNAGRTFDPDESQEMLHFITQCINSKQSKTASDVLLNKYSRKATSRTLDLHLQTMLNAE